MDKVIIELSWNEYELLLGLMQVCKDSVDNQKVKDLYVKLYMERKIERV
jgi:hypothetical protein